MKKNKQAKKIKKALLMLPCTTCGVPAGKKCRHIKPKKQPKIMAYSVVQAV